MATLQRNSLTPSEAASYLDQYEKIENDIDTIMGEALNKVKRERDRQKDLLDDYKSKGGNKGVVKSAFKVRKLHAKISKLMKEQEDDAEKELDDLLNAIGGLSELPLGKAAVAKAEPAAAAAKAKNEKQDTARTQGIVKAVKDSMTDEEVERNKRPTGMSDADWNKAKPQGNA